MSKDLESFLDENDLLKFKEDFFHQSIYNDCLKLNIYHQSNGYVAVTGYFRAENYGVGTLYYKEKTLSEILHKFSEDCRKYKVPIRTLSSVKFIKGI